MRRSAAVLAAVAAVAIAAQVSVPVPGSPVPQSLQTLAVVLVGAWLGPRDGASALALYVVLGAGGLPIFADGAGGPTHLTGPTLGYLVGFVVGASLMGWWVRQTWGWGAVGAFCGGVVVHGVILALGWVRLGMLVGPIAGWENGVAPFLWGGVAKSLVAAAVWVGVPRWVDATPAGVDSPSVAGTGGDRNVGTEGDAGTTASHDPDADQPSRR